MVSVRMHAAKSEHPMGHLSTCSYMILRFACPWCRVFYIFRRLGTSLIALDLIVYPKVRGIPWSLGESGVASQADLH